MLKFCCGVFVVVFICESIASASSKNVVEMKRPGIGKKEVSDDLKQKLEELKNKIKEPLGVDELEPPDHLDAVKLEQDGSINKDYQEEIFLGNHEEIDDDTSEIAESKLKDIFHKVDNDNDGYLSSEEIETWIQKKTQEHFDEAKEQSAHVFHHLDPDGDGLVDWEEYCVHFLLAKGFELEEAIKHVQDKTDIKMGYKDWQSLIEYKIKWMEADIDPMDKKLSKKEFLAFRHPELNEHAFNKMVTRIMESADKNHNGLLHEEEFVEAVTNEARNGKFESLQDLKWQTRQLFYDRIDKDYNGNVTKEELREFLDPKNPDHAKIDCGLLLEMLDENKDEKLSWKEIMKHKEVFIQSKVVNVNPLLHDEF